DCIDYGPGRTLRDSRKPVVDVKPLFALANELRSPEVGKVSRHLGLTGPNRINEVGDTHLARTGQQIEEPQSRFISTRIQDSQHHFNHLGNSSIRSHMCIRIFYIWFCRYSYSIAIKGLLE